MIADRYRNNIGQFFTASTQEEFLNKTFAVLGCGGQGGYLAEYLTRLGVKKLILIDGDNFEISNLNRQLGATESTLNQNKAQIIGNRCKEINSTIDITIIPRFFGEKENDYLLLINCSCIFIAMDFGHYGLNAKNNLYKLIEQNIPIIVNTNHLFGSFITIIDKQHLTAFYNLQAEAPKEKEKISQPAYLCAVTAGLAVNEMIKYFSASYNIPVGYARIFDLQHDKIVSLDEYGEF